MNGFNVLVMCSWLYVVQHSQIILTCKQMYKRKLDYQRCVKTTQIFKSNGVSLVIISIKNNKKSTNLFKIFAMMITVTMSLSMKWCILFGHGPEQILVTIRGKTQAQLPYLSMSLMWNSWPFLWRHRFQYNHIILHIDTITVYALTNFILLEKTIVCCCLLLCD